MPHIVIILLCLQLLLVGVLLWSYLLAIILTPIFAINKIYAIITSIYQYLKNEPTKVEFLDGRYVYRPILQFFNQIYTGLIYIGAGIFIWQWFQFVTDHYTKSIFNHAVNQHQLMMYMLVLIGIVISFVISRVVDNYIDKPSKTHQYVHIEH